MSIYRPLRVSQTEIRILDIGPASNLSDPLECTLQYSPLGGNPRYDALSYCWGDPTKQEDIQVSGESVRIRANLAHALRAFRQRGVLSIWVDAICINQDDTEERSQQVMIMNAIYRSAQTVIAWLGYSYRELDSKTETTLDRAKLLADRLAKDSSAGRLVLDARQVDELDTRAAWADYWTVFADFIDNPYWSRVWIIQELAMASRLVFLWNDRTISEDTFATQIAIWSRFRGKDRFNSQVVVNSSSCGHIIQLWEFRKSQRTLTPIRLLRALQMSHMAISTDKRDKVFAILGLTYDGPTFLSMPNYILPHGEISRQATWKLLQLTNSLDYIFVRNKPEGAWYIQWFDGLTWSNKRVISYLLGECRCLLLNRQGSKASTASKWNTSGNKKPYIKLSGSRLVVRGNIIGSVHNLTTKAEVAVLPTWHPHSPQGERKFKSKQYAHEALLFCFGMIVDPSPEKWEGGAEKSFYEEFGQFFLTTLGPFPKWDVWRWLISGENENLLLYWPDGTLREALGWKRPRPWSKLRTAKEWTSQAWATLKLGWKLCVMETGHIGWVTSYTMPGDLIAVIHGCSVLAVLRPVPGGGLYRVIGDGIIYGLMDGEGLVAEDEQNITLM